MKHNQILVEDLEYIKKNIDSKSFKDSVILITGAAGFLGYYFINFFLFFAEDLCINKIIALDNFLVGEKTWLKKLADKFPNKLIFKKFDIIKDDLGSLKYIENVNIIIHMASIASPTYYRKYPIETLDANVFGLRKILDYYKDKNIKSFLFFSSSEVYGDPPPEKIPLSETYCGNVATIGPRACYDEAKRFGETLSYLFFKKYNLPIKIVRPFNNYGPGMTLDDKRVPADFAKSILENRDIIIFSNGKPTRTFCYVADAIIGYMKIITYNDFDVFNIGIDKPEINIKELAKIYQSIGKKLFNYRGNIKFTKPNEENYLTHNPQRRCPSIEKAKKKLNYNPKIYIEEGVERFLTFLKLNRGEL